MSINQAAYPNDKNALGVSYETAALIGKRLRQAREVKRLSPSQVSARVKIRDRYIEAIEIGDWDVLPPGLNGRGLIRLYARELNVAIPEFETFHHLQTVMVERQSESLMQASSKKSKYHPAAEESAEIIRSISRSDFQKGINLDPDNSNHSPQNSAEESNSAAKVYSRNTGNFGANRSAHGSHTNIVTPNIYDVLGIQVENKAVSAKSAEKTHISKAQPEIKMNVNYQTLPTAEPVKIEQIIPKNVQKVEEVAEESMVSESAYQESQKENTFIEKEPIYGNNKTKQQEEVLRKKLIDFNPLQILVLLSFVIIFIFLSLFLYSRNNSQVKVTNLSAKQIENEVGDSEPLPNSLVESNIPVLKETDKVTKAQPQTKTSTEEDASKSTPNLTPQSINSAEKNKVALDIERIAKLNIAGKVNLVVEADGQQIFSGVHSAGVLDIPFKTKAEIVISDSSKVSLIYEGINHGVMGYAGRKRKILLNAKPYVE
ncbi:helix-turn-helix transcriptional regulator [Pigmentibacter sp. JX0631]|uniref:helix-turn-helix domain-containing protein n=1 Tax=Pigmentibacter sp. JX0631 TaxID=2976982 RepID=UPI002469BF2C|nr:helix-turn-helix transcriptional regulator [Pigmentibacter sp. JX0631]WGL58516.1 helix-turn-helix transcriptional regulator [Pigmentibacter sp. JX0631]